MACFKASRHPVQWLLAHVGVSLVMLMLSGVGTVVAETESDRIPKIKAAFTYNFVKFVEWPAEAFAEESSPIVVVVVGTERMRLTLQQTVAGKQVRGRYLEVTRLPVPTADTRDEKQRTKAINEFVQRLESSHLVYFESGEHDAIIEILERSHMPRHVLTVGDGRSYVGAPTMLDLVMSDGRLTFYANRERIETSQLKISSKLLRLARQEK